MSASVGTMDVSGEEKYPPRGLAQELFGALAVRVELWAGEGFRWATRQGGQCVSPLLGGGDKPTTLPGWREFSRMEVTGASWHVVHLSVC